VRGNSTQAQEHAGMDVFCRANRHVGCRRSGSGDVLVCCATQTWPSPTSYKKALAMRFNVFCAFVLACALGGCMSSGNESIADATNATVSGQLLKGKTTQTDVRRIYGDPIKTSFSSNGFETWEYEFTRLQSKPTNFIPYVNLVHSGAEGDKKALVIFFDKQKIVQDYTMSTSRIDMSRGIITR
jgi:hypothetical protein